MRITQPPAEKLIRPRSAAIEPITNKTIPQMRYTIGLGVRWRVFAWLVVVKVTRVPGMRVVSVTRPVFALIVVL